MDNSQRIARNDVDVARVRRWRVNNEEPYLAYMRDLIRRNNEVEKAKATTIKM
jgi:hypothetical protein